MLYLKPCYFPSCCRLKFASLLSALIHPLLCNPLCPFPHWLVLPGTKPSVCPLVGCMPWRQATILPYVFSLNYKYQEGGWIWELWCNRKHPIFLVLFPVLPLVCCLPTPPSSTLSSLICFVNSHIGYLSFFTSHRFPPQSLPIKPSLNGKSLATPHQANTPQTPLHPLSGPPSTLSSLCLSIIHSKLPSPQSNTRGRRWWWWWWHKLQWLGWLQDNIKDFYEKVWQLLCWL